MDPLVVIGAGPAGSTAAALLAHAGLAVILVEQSRFPRDKVCGECISALGWGVLGRLGLADTLRDQGAVQLLRAQLHSPDGRMADLELPQPMWGLSRARLDAMLLKSAREAGADVRLPARCEALQPTVQIRDLLSNETATLRPPFTILADGKSALLKPRPRPTRDLGLKAHFSNVELRPGTIALFGVSGHYCGVAPIEGGKWNVAFNLPRRRVQTHLDLDNLFAAILTENRTLARAFHSARRVSDWLASPLPRFPVRTDWPDGIIPIGNAAAALEPVGGEGMGLAMRSAELAAAEIIHSIRSRTPLRFLPLQREFRKLWRTRRLACRAAGLFVSQPTLCGSGLDWLHASPQLSRLALSLVGK